MSSPVNRVENYTTTCLVLGLVNLLWIFAAIWALFGFVWVLFTGWVLNLGITRLARR
ncbi:hypothetical protein [Shimia haliotis]|uniref:Uncharacterized protein n=1 Tax=Shimia haliotis TaxID=1280847 RepID=A0A1I4F4K1_9RHOB|nr:hypothetical protein [Shimia haliotis]SFL12479.1 hypothetical protein SAMN04488036_105188 [Shimia haliotis]